MKFLIDECLHPTLAQLAIQGGHVESTCVRDRGLSGTKDWQLMKFLGQHDYTLVTQNAQDFRGVGKVSPGGLFATEAIHAGLICLTSDLAMTPKRQQILFAEALKYLQQTGCDLVNQALEVFEDANATITVDLYDIPPK